LKNAGGVLHGMVAGDQANIAALCEYCNIHPEDVIVSKYAGSSELEKRNNKEENRKEKKRINYIQSN
jgi:hypothetical protein